MNRTNLDAMIQRADFADLGDDFTMDLFQNFPITNLEKGSPILSLLRKPDFQRETNHWTPLQVQTFIASFLDNELIPSLILWKSPTHIFVIDGGHRLSALRAWMEDDYGDGAISKAFYGSDIPETQKKSAQRTRRLIENSIGRYSTLKASLSEKAALSEIADKRARNLFTRSLNLQWVQGSPSVAETSFFKINSQGTPLDDTEEMLLRNRRRPVAIGARAVVRSGFGHKYWSSFPMITQEAIEKHAENLFRVLFRPEIDEPIKSLDLPLAGTASPIDALSILIELIAICDLIKRHQTIPSDIRKGLEGFPNDLDGSLTIRVLENTTGLLQRITGNGKGSLGLHPAVYFYNDKGKHSRFLFLGTILLFAEKLANNDSQFFQKFTQARELIEDFLIENKGILNLVLQNVSKNVRVTKVRDLLDKLVTAYSDGTEFSLQQALEGLGARGRVLDISNAEGPKKFSDDSKSAIYLRTAIQQALKCPICSGLLDVSKSVSYDHITPVREGGLGTEDNGQLSHPYCNQSVKC